MDRREELAERFLSSLGKTIHCLKADFRHEMVEYGVTWPQFHLMKMIDLKGEITVTDVSEMLIFSSPTASRMIDGLCRKELVEKRKGKHDQRVTFLFLTGKGKKLLDKMLTAHRKLMADILAEVDPERLEIIIEELENVSEIWLTSVRESMGKDSNEHKQHC